MNRQESLFWQLYNKGFSPAYIKLKLEMARLKDKFSKQGKKKGER